MRYMHAVYKPTWRWHYGWERQVGFLFIDFGPWTWVFDLTRLSVNDSQK